MIRCFYNCNVCGIKKQYVNVPSRKAEQDIVEWVELVIMPLFAADHRMRSPFCRATKLDVGIPIKGAKLGEEEE